MNIARSRYRSHWLMEGCNDNKPHPSMSPGDWADCAKFWKSKEGHQLSKCMSLVRSRVGRPKECGQETKFFGEQNMVCCSHCFMKSPHFKLGLSWMQYIMTASVLLYMMHTLGFRQGKEWRFRNWPATALAVDHLLLELQTRLGYACFHFKLVVHLDMSYEWR